MTNEEQVRRTKTAVEAVLAYARLQKAMAAYGYDKKKMLEGKARWEKVEMLNHLQKKEYGESYEATDSLELARAEARQLYMRHLEVARVALKDNRGASKTLQLSGNRKRGMFGWLAQARTFYANVEGVKETLAKFSLTEDELKQGQAMIEAVYQAHSTRRKEYSEAKQSTQNRDKALSELNDWMRAFVGIAKVAFANDSEALELLGLLKTA
ncbi:MAG: hypothetical protein WA960_12065 [Tunicatimonas sp.]